VSGLGSQFWVSGCLGLESQVPGFVTRVLGFGFRVSSLRFRVSDLVGKEFQFKHFLVMKLTTQSFNITSKEDAV